MWMTCSISRLAEIYVQGTMKLFMIGCVAVFPLVESKRRFKKSRDDPGHNLYHVSMLGMYVAERHEIIDLSLKLLLRRSHSGS